MWKDGIGLGSFPWQRSLELNLKSNINSETTLNDMVIINNQTAPTGSIDNVNECLQQFVPHGCQCRFMLNYEMVGKVPVSYE